MLDRRAFIGLGATALAGINLPALADFSREASDLSLRPLELAVGAKKPFRAIHFSDSHLAMMSAKEQVNDSAKQAFRDRMAVFPQSVINFTATLDYAAERKMLLLNTGDVIDYASEACFAYVKRSLAPFRGRLLCAMGNHEYWDPIRGRSCDRLRELSAAALGNDLTAASRIVNGVNIVALDTGLEQVYDEAARRVKAEFAKGLPVVLMMHEPFYGPELYRESFITRKGKEKYGTACLVGVPEEKLAEYAPNQVSYARPRPSTVQFIDWLRRQRQLKAILCGHKHFYFEERFSETAVQYVVGANFRGDGYEICFK